VLFLKSESSQFAHGCYYWTFDTYDLYWLDKKKKKSSLEMSLIEQHENLNHLFKERIYDQAEKEVLQFLQNNLDDLFALELIAKIHEKCSNYNLAVECYQKLYITSINSKYDAAKTN
jgi:tetratricopeptide (TPR) repeat protein